MTQRPKEIWKGSYVLRGGQYKDKWGNPHNSPVTYRNTNQGIVVDSRGNFLGTEHKHTHNYGRDEKKAKKPSTFVRPNFAGARKPRRSHIRNL